MTDLETEIVRQIHELSKELIALRERVAVLEATSIRCNQDGLPVETLGFRPCVSVATGNPDWYKHSKQIAETIRARGEQ